MESSINQNGIIVGNSRRGLGRPWAASTALQDAANVIALEA